jgi:hypothetical protein
MEDDSREQVLVIQQQRRTKVPRRPMSRRRTEKEKEKERKDKEKREERTRKERSGLETFPVGRDHLPSRCSLMAKGRVFHRTRILSFLSINHARSIFREMHSLDAFDRLMPSHS